MRPPRPTDRPTWHRPRRVRPARAPCSPSSGPSGCSRRWPTTAAPWACRSWPSESGLPLPTIHRLLRTLVDLGYLRQDCEPPVRPRAPADPARRELGRDAQRLGQARTSTGWSTSSASRPTWPCSTATRSSTSPRRSHGARCGCSPRSAAASCRTARRSARRSWRRCRRTRCSTCCGVPACRSTPRTPSPTPTPSPSALLWVGEHGYAIDDEEQEHGVRCVAVAVPDAPTRLGLSVSGPATRMTPEVIERTVPDPARRRRRPSRDLSA